MPQAAGAQIAGSSNVAFEALLEMLPHTVLRVDGQGVCTFAKLTPGFLNLSDGDIQHYLGQSLQAILPQPLAQSILAAIGNLSTDGESHEHTLLPHELYQPVAVRLLRTNAHEVLVMLRDLSDSAQRREPMTLAQHLDSVSTLAAGLSHEINNPLAFLLANLAYITDELTRLPLAETKRAELHEVLHETQVGAQRIAGVVQDLRTFAQVDSNERRGVSLSKALDRATIMTQHEVRPRAALQRDDVDELMVMANESKLANVFANILLNAAHAVPAGDPDNHRIVVRTERRGADARVRISDDGLGMSKEVLERVFDPFFTTKPIGLGMGLGLSFTHGAIQELSGTIVVQSSPRSGTVVTVTLPLAPMASEMASVGPQVTFDTPPKILVVDDEPYVGLALERILSGFALTLCTSGQQALELMQTHEFDALLLDILMPEMTGLELFNEIRSSQPNVANRVVFMTGGVFTDSQDNIQQFLGNLSNFCVQKPFKSVELREILSVVVAAGKNLNAS